MKILEKKIILISLVSRALILIVGALLGGLIEDYDSSTELRLDESDSSNWITKLFLPFYKWDSVYFMQISTNGYEYEQYHAFFPAYPLLISLFSSFFNFFSPFLSSFTIHLISALIISNLSFVIANLYLFK